MFSLKQKKTKVSLWSFFSYFFISVLIAPPLFFLVNSLSKTSPSTKKIVTMFLGTYTKNTAIILVFTLCFCLLIGFISACIMSFYNFKGKKIFEFLLILPFAIPSYILAYIYTDFFSYGGIIYKIMQRFGIFFNLDIMNIKGLIFILICAFYPYSYIIFRSYLKRLDQNILDSAVSLGAGKCKLIFKILIPVSYPAILSASLLIIMEVLNAFGVPYYFGVQVFSTGIFHAWVSFQDIEAATKLSFILILFIGVVSGLIYMMKNAKKYQYSSGAVRFIQPKNISGVKAFAAYFYLILLISISFIIPCIHLILWLYHSIGNVSFVASSFFFTLFVGIFSASLIVIVSIILANHSRYHHDKFNKLLFRVATIGYGIPGIIIAIATLSLFIKLDRFIFGRLIFTLSIIPLFIAYTIRFIMVSFNSIDAGFNKCGLKFSKASKSLGAGEIKTFLKVDLPLIKANIIGAFLLSFIEIIKDLPITSLLIPFNRETLAITISNYAAQERITDIAFPAILIIVISTALLYLFTRNEKNEIHKN
ncbi:MAG: hypothetical protein CR988_06500 [Treponema sp.]|nr:MAG: hypothetical protein CR988_06500 [Treponema sp.]